MAEVADREGVLAPSRRRALRVAPILEAGEGRGVTPDQPVVVDLQSAPGPSPSDAARVPAPLVRRTDRELALGRAVELPHRAGREGRQGRLFDGDRAGST